MAFKYIGYVSTPFGTKDGIILILCISKPYTHPPSSQSAIREVILFREDGSRPQLDASHKARIEAYRGSYQTHEWQLRQSIQDNIVGSDFLIAVLTSFNPNVMLEIGFAQAHKKIIVYVLDRNQFVNMPANLTNLKRLHLYRSNENLKANLYNRIQEVIDDLKQQNATIKTRGGFSLDYYPNRNAVDLVHKFRNATSIIKILTTNLTTVSANYIDAIVAAVTDSPGLSVQILTSDPVNAFIDPRANQLLEDKKGMKWNYKEVSNP